MQTFLPFPDFDASARALDRLRLGKQRVETVQILNTLTGASDGWRNHPAVRMWRGHERALCVYGASMCREWIARGYRDSLLPVFEHQLGLLEPCKLPAWVGDIAFHRSHQSNLLRKDPAHYGPQFEHLMGGLPPNDLPYVWPV